MIAGLAAGEQLLAQPRGELLGTKVAPTTSLALLTSSDRPRGNEARRAL